MLKLCEVSILDHLSGLQRTGLTGLSKLQRTGSLYSTSGDQITQTGLTGLPKL